MTVLKRKDFARWQAGEKDALYNAAKEMENGLIDADRGGLLYRTRVIRSGGGKSGGYRTILSARIGKRYVFLHGFAKKDKANIASGGEEDPAVRRQGIPGTLSCRPGEGAAGGILVEVHCVPQTH